MILKSKRGIDMKKNDWILGGGIVLAAILALAFQLSRGNGRSVIVTSEGEIYGTYSLAQDQTIDINGTNRLVIADGTAVMEWADCPDQICVNHGSVSRNGESIICLPNKVVVTVQDKEETKVDGVIR